MTTNKDWLFSLPLEEQIAWMNAEHEPDYVRDTLADYQEQRIAKLLKQRDSLQRQVSACKEMNDNLLERLDRIAEVASI